MKVSLISTVYNEADNMAVFLSSILQQSRLPDEIVICDAGSTDGTLQILEEFSKTFPHSIKVIVESGNRSHGRNVAIGHTTYEIIAGTDAGCLLDKHWLEFLVAPFESDPTVDVVSGFYQARGETVFEECASVVTLSTKGVTSDSFIPSTRSIAFKKRSWKVVGGFPEHLEFAEDTKFGLDLRNAKMRFAFAEKAIVFWRPRDSIKKIFTQQYNYARGNVKANIYLFNYFRLHTRYLVWVLLAYGSLINPWILLLWVLAFVPYWVRWSVVGWQNSHDISSLLWTPWIKLVADAGQVYGFWLGMIRRKST